MVQSQVQSKQDLLEAIQREIDASWRWENYNRSLMHVLTAMTWLSGFILLALTSYQVAAYGSTPAPTWFRLLLAVFALLSISIPQLNAVCRFQQKQQVHDLAARSYEVLKTRLMCDQITVENALLQYERITKQSPEMLSRTTV